MHTALESSGLAGSQYLHPSLEIPASSGVVSQLSVYSSGAKHSVQGSKNNTTFIYPWVLFFQINYRDVYEAGLLTTQIWVVHSNTYSLGETVIAMLNIIYSVVPFSYIFNFIFPFFFEGQ